MTPKIHHDVKVTSLSHRHVMTSKIWSWCQKYRHDVKNTSRSQRVCHDVEQIVMTSKSFLVISRIRYDVKTFVMMSKSAFTKAHRAVKNKSIRQIFSSWRQTVHYTDTTTKNTSWRQKYVITSKLHHEVKIRYGVKKFVMTSQISSLCQKYVIIMTSQISSWCQKFVMKTKSSSWRQKVRHEVTKCVMTSKKSSWR